MNITIHTYYGEVTPSTEFTFRDATVDEVIRGVTFDEGCTHVKASLESDGKLFVCKKPVFNSGTTYTLVSVMGAAEELSRVAADV